MLDARTLTEGIQRHVAQAKVLSKADYISAVDRETLQVVTTVNDQSLLAIAVWFGAARLIDNIELASDEGA